MQDWRRVMNVLSRKSRRLHLIVNGVEYQTLFL